MLAVKRNLNYNQEFSFGENKKMLEELKKIQDQVKKLNDQQLNQEIQSKKQHEEIKKKIDCNNTNQQNLLENIIIYLENSKKGPKVGKENIVNLIQIVST